MKWACLVPERKEFGSLPIPDTRWLLISPHLRERKLPRRYTNRKTIEKHTVVKSNAVSSKTYTNFVTPT
jgi:hypothetical protein